MINCARKPPIGSSTSGADSKPIFCQSSSYIHIALHNTSSCQKNKKSQFSSVFLEGFSISSSFDWSPVAAAKCSNLLKSMVSPKA